MIIKSITFGLNQFLLEALATTHTNDDHMVDDNDDQVVDDNDGQVTMMSRLLMTMMSRLSMTMMLTSWRVDISSLVSLQ